jgi:chorismate synthase
MKTETDAVKFTAGVRGGVTLGSPIVMSIKNRDFANWQGRMGAEPFETPPEALTRPRPGHADLAGGLKYGHSDLRNVLERASARETASRVAAGAVCRAFLRELEIEVFAHVLSIGAETAQPAGTPAELQQKARASEMACADAEAEARMRTAIHQASHAGDTLGGVFEVVASGAPAGLGSHVQWDLRLDGRLAQALMSIPAIKGVEIGLGFEAARRPGSQVHDPIGFDTALQSFTRSSNGAGGLEGGISNGSPIVCRAAMKPISTLKKALPSVDIHSKQSTDAAFERSDVCAVPAASVVGEAMVLLVLCDAVREKFGGDSLREVLHNVNGYKLGMREFPHD